MRRITVIGMIILGLVALPLMAAAKSDKAPDKMEICHVDDDGETHVIEVSPNAVAAHYGHNDPEFTEGDIAQQCAALDSGVDAGDSAPPTAEIQVSESNCTPVTFFPLPTFLCSLSLDGGASVGDIDSYTWIGVHQETPFTTTGPSPIVENLRPGTYTIQLIVEGPGGTATSSMDVTLSF